MNNLKANVRKQKADGRWQKADSESRKAAVIAWLSSLSHRLIAPSLSRVAAHLVTALVSLHISLFTFLSCTIEPPLHLPDEGADIILMMPEINLDLDVLWDYSLVIDEEGNEFYDSTYHWRDDWYYGWDSQDNAIFGTWEIIDPQVFNIRRYYTGADMNGPHPSPNEHQIEGRTLKARYNFGYYDILAWNEVQTIDGVQSLHFDESTTKEFITCYTNSSMVPARHSQKKQYAYYQPEFLFGGYYEDMYVSNDPADYDGYDEATNTYYKNAKMTLYPRTYIYITQIILHNNRGRIAGVEGSANLSGMSRMTNLNTGVTSYDEISVNYYQRMKRNVMMKGEQVDIIGGRLFTFGLCGLNPSRSTRASASDNKVSNFLDVNLYFNNGLDSTYVFNVTDQVHRRYKGGILTIELDVDTMKIPSRKSGSGFDAVVKDYDTLTYEIPM